jgi:beta-lactamase regulating signal transducer with metallopeptidase domain
MLHGSSVAACCAVAAWAAEHALAFSSRPRRVAWIVAMLLSVSIPATSLLAPGQEAPRLPISPTLAAASATSAPVMVRLTQLPAMPVSAPWERVMAWSWACMSAAVLAFYAVAAWRLARRARSWSPDAEQSDVLVARDIGPAVFGLLRPRIVLPRWLGAAPEATKRLVLEHERQHIAARDPLLLAAALLLIALLPWNLPLLWQMRRLRLALELDCDARVLAAEVDPLEYGEALLLVNQRTTAAPAGAIALIERPSQLERRIRIMTAATQRFRRPMTALAGAFAASCLFAATSINTPALAMDAPLKPTPTGASALRLGQHFEKMLAERFPGLLEQDHDRMPMVIVLLDEDWSIARAAQVISSDELPANEGSFGVIGLAREDVPYVGNMGMQSPDNPKHVVLVVYTEHKTPGKRFVSHVFPDTRAVDRAIFRRNFPLAAQADVPAGQQPWVLLDREGHVLRSGQEPVVPSEWNHTLESRFPGIKTEGITVTPLTDDAGEPLHDGAGRELQLHSVWLASGSPKP